MSQLSTFLSPIHRLAQPFIHRTTRYKSPVSGPSLVLDRTTIQRQGSQSPMYLSLYGQYQALMMITLIITLYNSLHYLNLLNIISLILETLQIQFKGNFFCNGHFLKFYRVMCSDVNQYYNVYLKTCENRQMYSTDLLDQVCDVISDYHRYVCRQRSYVLGTYRKSPDRRCKRIMGIMSIRQFLHIVLSMQPMIEELLYMVQLLQR